MDRLKKIFGKTTKWVIAPIGLFLLWLALSLHLLDSEYGLLNLTQVYSSDVYDSPHQQELHQGEKVKGSLVAKFPNLGSIQIRFKNFGRINSDNIIFRVKESGAKDWFYTNTYRSDQFQPDLFFPFGFPPIQDSRGKEYVFEIESERGVSGDAVGLSLVEPTIQTVHQYTSSYLKENPIQALNFGVAKVTAMLTDVKFMSATFLYILPFVFYVSYILFLKRIVEKLSSYKHPPVVFVILPSSFFLILLLYIFVSDVALVTNVLFYFLWAFIIIVYRLRSRASFFLAFIFSLFVIPLVIFGNNRGAENTSLFVFNFLLIGTLQQIIDLKNHTKNQIEFKEFLNKLALSLKGLRKK